MCMIRKTISITWGRYQQSAAIEQPATANLLNGAPSINSYSASHDN